MQNDLILGTAGHIDHGKTSLVGKLTGTFTDRLPEEKKRGITIELGYAQLQLPPYRLGIVDVPGHEKFVRQMLAGATGMDMAMLVVAGDDSIKQQTREHLDIIRLLNLSTGVIALTKCDLAEADWLDLVEDEIRELVAGTFLQDAAIIRCSSKTGQGIEELKAALLDCCQRVANLRGDQGDQPFRMAIDRSFSVEGHGTVVTGSVSSGSIQVGDHVEIQPGGREARIRGIQNHDTKSDSVSHGQRAAINMAGLHHHDVHRGHELCAPGHLCPSKILLVDLMLLNNVKKPLKDRTRIRFHIGTAELMANVRLLECEALEPGETSLAQLYLSEEAAAVWNQPFVVRSESPVMTIGGGRVLHPNSVLLNRPTDTDIRHGQAMRSGEPSQRAAASVYLAASADTNRGDGWQQSEWPRTAGVTQLDSVYQQLTDSKQLVELRLSQSRSLVVHCDRVSQIGDRIQKSLRRLHDQFPLRFSHPRNVVENEFSYLDQPVLLAAVIDHLKRQKLITANVNSIGLVGRGPKLSKGQKQLLEWLTTQVKEAGLQGPTAKALEKSATKNKDSVEELLSMAVENGDMIKLMPTGFHISTSAFSEAKDSLAHAMEGTDGLKVTEIGQLLGISRRWSVPICEYLDETGFTKRIDDRRVLNTPSLTVS